MENSDNNNFKVSEELETIQKQSDLQKAQKAQKAKIGILKSILEKYEKSYQKKAINLDKVQLLFFDFKKSFLAAGFSKFIKAMKIDMYKDKLETQKITGKDLINDFGLDCIDGSFSIRTDNLDCNDVFDICNRIEALYVFQKHKFVERLNFSSAIERVLDFYFKKHFKDEAMSDNCLDDMFIELLNRNEDLFFGCLDYIRKFRDNENYCKITKLHDSLIEKLMDETDLEVYTHIFAFSASFLKALYRDDANFDMWDDKSTHYMRRDVERKIFKCIVSSLKSKFENSIDLECLIEFFTGLPRFNEDNPFVTYSAEETEFVGWYKREFFETFKGQVADDDFSYLGKDEIDRFKKVFGDDFLKFFNKEQKDEQKDEQTNCKRSKSVGSANHKPKCSERVNRSCERKKNSFEI